VANGATSVGFIVKLPNWAAKDVNKDQFIDVSAYVSGTVHIYVKSGKEGFETVLGDDVVSGIKVKSAVYKEDIGFFITTTAPVASARTEFAISGPDGPLTISALKQGLNNVYTVITEEKIDLLSSYHSYLR